MNNLLKKITKNSPRSSQGFTLVEMLVVIIIITILLLVILLNYRDINSKSVLKNIAYEVGLTIREAQSYGLGVKKYAAGGGDITPGGGLGSFNKPYGVHFNSGASEEKFLYLFIDENDSGLCDNCTAGTCAGAGECELSLELASDALIDDVCLTDIDTGFESNLTLGTESTCFEDIGGIEQAAVRFKRPNPDALFKGDSGSDPTEDGGALKVYLRMNRIQDYRQVVEVTTLGQIRVYGEEF